MKYHFAAITIALFTSFSESKNARRLGTKDMCSGNGVKYATEETTVLAFYDLMPTCECFDCYSGKNCEIESPMEDCVADASGVDLGLTKDVIVAPENIIKSSYRLDYEGWKDIEDGDPDKPIEFILHKTLTDLHAAIGNVKTKGYTLIVGMGSHQLLEAANFALSKTVPKEEASVYSQVPYWSKFPRMADTFAPRTKWADETDAEAAEAKGSLIEIVVSPSNPANLLHGDQADIKAPKERQVWDLVYYWPSSFADADALVPLEEDIMIFSLSKLAGYAAHRFGWAWVRDSEVAADMSNYLSVTTQSYPANEMLFSINILQSILGSIGTKDDFFKVVQMELMDRYTLMEEVLAQSNGLFKFGSVGGNMYTTVQCDGPCLPYFEEIGLEVSPGASMGLKGEEAENTVRLCFGYERSRFDVILKKLKMLPKGK